jgi:2-alkenal reductase
MSLKRIIYVLVIAFVAVAAALSGAVAGGVAVYMAIVSNNSTTTTQAPVQAVSTGNTTLNISTTQIETTITQAVAKAGSSVVTVVGTIKGQMTFFGQSPDQQVSGSGVIVSSTGYVVTNNHVVENTDSVSVILANGKTLSGTIVGTDQFSDLAVIKVQDQMPAIATLGNSDTLKPGESVIAIGSPLGDLKNTVTVGVVSATGRNIDTGNGYQLVDMIQTDAAINHGNSGGPLVNLNGEVIGINTLIVRGSGFSGDVAEGLGFAIPSNTAKAVAEQIIQKGYVSRPYIGIQWQWITPSISAMYSLPVQWGVYISQIDSGSPAAKSGLQRGDIITRIGDTALDDSHPYINALYQHAPGEPVKLEVIRGDKTLDIQVTLGESR